MPPGNVGYPEAVRRLAPIVALLCALLGLAPTAAADDICTRAGFATDGGATVTRFATADGASTTATIAGAALRQPAVSPDGTTVLVPDEANDRLVVLRGGSGADTGTRIAVGDQPTKVLFAPDGTRAFVLNAGSRTVGIVDVAAARTISASDPFSRELVDIALSADGTRLYALLDDSADPIEIVQVPIGGGAVTSVALTGTVPTAGYRIAITGSTLVLAVGAPSGDHLATASTGGGAVALSSATLAGPATDLALAADGRSAYVAAAAQSLETFTVGSLARTQTASVAAEGLAVGPSGLVYAAEGTRIGTFTSAGSATGSALAIPATHVAICTSTATIPAAPTALGLQRGDRAIGVSWTAPTADGGAAITAYEVVSTPDSATCTATGPDGCVVSGLRNGRSYTFVARARNAVGWGPWSLKSVGMQPRRDTGARALGVSPVTVRTTRKAVVLSARVTVPGPGLVAQSALVKGKRYCAASRQVAAAGTYLIRCTVKGAGRRLVRQRATTFLVRTTFTPTFGSLAWNRQDVTAARRR